MDEATEELFCDLMEMPSSERLAALEAMESIPDELRTDLRRMLKEAVEAGRYFTRAADAVRALPASRQMEKEGEMCGPYRLVRILGEGGFGVVWQAEQEHPIRRVVALKVIKAGMDTKEVIARFDAEKQALARMAHPNIAKVLDAGMTGSGRPFFVMELVEGIPITAYCKARRLGTRERLRLFSDVCAALAHAHQKGVIHRDIKPSNVMVTETDGVPAVKVIDFGIAKAVDVPLTDRTLRTKIEQWIGTPTYMSPEQAGLASTDLDTRSDVYSLGVLLYELITGVAPFDSDTLLGAGYEEMRRIIREVEPPRPSTRVGTETKKATASGNASGSPEDLNIRGVASELDWIVMKALEKSRDRRYATASALADDVGRFLSDQPVEARPPSSLYLLSKFARRHRVGFLVASAFVVLFVAAGLLSAWLALRATDAEQAAQRSLAEALRDRDRRDQALHEAEAFNSLLSEVLQRPRPGVNGRSVTVLQALDEASEKLDRRLAAQPQRLASLRGVLADTYHRLGIHDRSLDLREKIFETARETSGADHFPARHALRKVVEAAEATGDGKIALQYALLEREILNDTKAAPQELEAAMRSVVMARFGVGERAKALEQQARLVEFCERNFGTQSAPHLRAIWEMKQYVAGQRDGDGQAGADATGSIGGLENEFATALEAHGNTHPATTGARLRLAGELLASGRTIEAQLHLSALHSLTMRSLGPHDDLTLEVQRELTRVKVKLGDEIGAVRMQQAVVSSLRERDGEDAATTIQAEDHLERRFFYSPLQEERAAYNKDLRERRVRLFGKDHPHTVMLLLDFDPDAPEESIANMKGAIRVLREKSGDRSRATAEAMAALARAHASLGRITEALEVYAECAPNMLDDTWLNFECATFQLWTGDNEGFRVTRRNILNRWASRIEQQWSRAEMFDRAVWLACIAELDDESQKATVREILGHSARMREGIRMEARDRHSRPLQKQIEGCALYRSGKYREAMEVFSEAIAIMNRGSTDTSSDSYQHAPPWAYFFMAMAEHQLGNREEARRIFTLGESRLRGGKPSQTQPKLKYFIGGEALTQWILHREAEALLSAR